MKKIVIGVFCLTFLLGLLYFLNEQNKTITIETGEELISSDSEILIYELAVENEEDGILTYNFKSSSEKEWFIQGIIDVNQDRTFSYDEWLIRNQKQIIREGEKVSLSFKVPEELIGSDLSELRVWVAATGREIGLINDILENEGFVVTVPVFYLSQEGE